MTVQKALNTILIVEDNPDDFYALQRLFQQSGLHNPLVRCDTGERALDYLHHRGKYTGEAVERPAMILLDIKLPGMKGTEVLTEIRNDPELKAIPVIMLTSSTDSRDMMEAFQGRADSYMTKPATFADFIMSVQRIKSHWFEIILTPRA